MNDLSSNQFFRKKPVVVEAWQWLGIDLHAAPRWVLDYRYAGQQVGFDAGDTLCIPTLEGLMTVSQFDWIIKGVKGELYPCKPDIFEATYERASDEPSAGRPPISEGYVIEAFGHFQAYVIKNMPSGTEIGNPTWWAPRLWMAANNAWRAAAPSEPPDDDQCVLCGQPLREHDVTGIQKAPDARGFFLQCPSETKEGSKVCPHTSKGQTCIDYPSCACTELPESLRDPMKVLERGRQIEEAGGLSTETAECLCRPGFLPSMLCPVHGQSGETSTSLTSAEEESLRERSDLMHKPAEY